MNQQSKPIGVPGGGGGPAGPGGLRPDTDELLEGVEDDLDLLDSVHTADQVPIFDRMHTTLADALARTADTGGPPAPGDPGA